MPTNAELNSTWEVLIKDYRASEEQQKSEILGLRTEVQAIKSNIQEFKGSMEDMKATTEYLSTSIYGKKPMGPNPWTNQTMCPAPKQTKSPSTSIYSKLAVILFYSLSDAIRVAAQIEDITARSSHKATAQKGLQLKQAAYSWGIITSIVTVG
ncbi:hypothetical protein M9H77_03315 [Catharanthus roseus]|uniref:Uncharacterized protein n=1 Tax=Catharanthus roseus TaxID=4058 RepID=A0ACC0CAW5_CATRO|nr:hypothetical protein M9H77_03315 [Catharanthus roseus]